MLIKELGGMRFNALSPSHYQATAAPDVHILYNGVHWLLVFSTSTGNEISVHESLQAAARYLGEMVLDVGDPDWSQGLV